MSMLTACPTAPEWSKEWYSPIRGTKYVPKVMKFEWTVKFFQVKMEKHNFVCPGRLSVGCETLCSSQFMGKPLKLRKNLWFRDTWRRQRPFFVFSSLRYKPSLLGLFLPITYLKGKKEKNNFASDKPFCKQSLPLNESLCYSSRGSSTIWTLSD